MKSKFPNNLARLYAACFLLGSAAMATQAQAQDHIIFGIGAASAPEYQGSSEQMTQAIPLIDISHGSLFMGLRNGIGAYPLKFGDFRIGTSIVYIPGFDLPYALGEVSGSAGARLFTDWERDGFSATFGITKAVSGDLEGLLADASISYRYNITPRLALIPGIGVTWADSSYNQSYFGLTPTQAIAAGTSSFSPESGFKDVSIGLSANYRITDHVSLTSSATISTLLGDARDSPIVFEDTYTVGFIGVSYRFGS